jgi:hypothetical protein
MAFVIEAGAQTGVGRGRCTWWAVVRGVEDLIYGWGFLLGQNVGIGSVETAAVARDKIGHGAMNSP